MLRRMYLNAICLFITAISCTSKVAIKNEYNQLRNQKTCSTLRNSVPNNTKGTLYFELSKSTSEKSELNYTTLQIALIGEAPLPAFKQDSYVRLYFGPKEQTKPLVLGALWASNKSDIQPKFIPGGTLPITYATASMIVFISEEDMNTIVHAQAIEFELETLSPKKPITGTFNPNNLQQLTHFRQACFTE